MNPDNRMEDARRRMEMRPPVVMENEGQMNDDPNLLSQYPRMMYRATEVEQREMQPGAEGFTDTEVTDKSRVINKYNGYLCETMIGHSAEEAEILAENGWDISPEAAHGVVAGKVAEVTAKNARIAELEALLAAQQPAPDGETPRRGPGRPPKQTVDE